MAAAARTRLCPACGTPNAARAAGCAQCGALLSRPRAARALVVLGVVAAAAGLGVVVGGATGHALRGSADPARPQFTITTGAGIGSTATLPGSTPPPSAP